ncbi:MAG: hypothetical protein WD771_06610 [Gemmatimonadaceae bacterium]
MLLRLSAATFAIAALLALPCASQAQQGRDVYRLPMPQAPQMIGQEMGRAQPGVAASSPVGFGPGKGDIFAGIGYQHSTGLDGDSDGAISVGGGFFNPRETVGLEVVLTSLSTVRSGFGSRMVAGAKLHKAFAGQTGVGVGVEGIKVNGDEFDTDPSIFAAVTHVRTLRQANTFNQLTANLGVGTGRFQAASDFAAGESGVGIFISGALRLNWASALILDYTGAQLNTAFSFTPSRTIPFVITPVLNDITGESGKAGRFALAAGMSWKY